MIAQHALIQIDKPARVAIEDVPRLIRPGHPAARLLIYMCRKVPLAQRWFGREELIKAGGFGDLDAVTRCTAFEWWQMRINDSLPLAGWKIDVIGSRHFLIPISEAFHVKLVERYERRRLRA